MEKNTNENCRLSHKKTEKETGGSIEWNNNE